MSCEKNNNCKLEIPRYDSYPPNDRKCDGGCDKDKCHNGCDNPIKVLSNNVLWNGCGLRYLNINPGDSIEEALIEADRKMKSMEKRLLELLDAYNELILKIPSET